jgi:transcriptional regulator with XRE-family HTH domain
MISSAVIEEVRRLLEEQKLSQRMIARQVGVSHGTVNAIWLGKRPEHRASRPDEDEEAPLFNSTPPQRCPSCGGLVQMPCLLCRVRSLREKTRRGRPLART